MPTRVLILEARFYDHIADGQLAGATQALEAAGAEWEIITVPGIYELPAALELVVASGRSYDGYITLGCAIRGESDHYGHVSSQCMRGLADLSVNYHLALGNGVLTVHDEAQALNRSDPARKNIGGLAARAALRMIDLKRELGIIQ